MVVIFEQSHEISFDRSGKGFGLSQKEESGGTGELDEVIERILAALTPCYVLFNRIEHYIRPLLGFSGTHRSELFIDEVIGYQIDAGGTIESVLGEDCFDSA